MKTYLLNFWNGTAAKLNDKMQFGNFYFSPLYHLSLQRLICLIIFQVFTINVSGDSGGMKSNVLVLRQGFHQYEEAANVDDDDDDDDENHNYHCKLRNSFFVMIGKGLDDKGILVRFTPPKHKRSAVRYIQLPIEQATGLLSEGVKGPEVKINSYLYLEPRPIKNEAIS
jgi:hypothetical protein